MTAHSPTRARLLVLAAAVLFSTGGAAIKGTALTSWQIAGFRSLIACIAVAILIPGARRWRWRYVPVAAAYAGTLILFVSATKLTTAANAIFLQDTAPLFLLLIGPLFLKEPIRKSDIVLMIAVATGMLLFFAGPEEARSTAPDPATGNMLGACSALTWAITVTGLRWVGRHSEDTSSGMAVIAMGNLLATLFTLPAAFPVNAFRLHDGVMLAWLGLFQIGLAYACLTAGIRYVPAFEATTLLLLEPALNPVWAWLVHHEIPGALSILGGCIILAATLGNAWWQNRSRVLQPESAAPPD